MSPRCWLWSQTVGHRMRSRRQLWSSSSQVNSRMNLMPSDCTQHFNGFKCSGISAKLRELLILLHCSCLICTPYRKLYLIVEWFGNCSEITWCSFYIRCDSGAVKEQTRFPCGGRVAMKCNDGMILEQASCRSRSESWRCFLCKGRHRAAFTWARPCRCRPKADCWKLYCRWGAARP